VRHRLLSKTISEIDEISGQTALPLTTMAFDKLRMGVLGVKLFSHRLA
jgi:hypothetical protein